MLCIGVNIPVILSFPLVGLIAFEIVNLER
jgi:hypothetical protein